MPIAKLMSRDETMDVTIESYAYAYSDADNMHDASWHRNWVGLHTPDHRITFDDIMLDSLLVAHYISVFESFVAGDVQEVVFAPTEPFISVTLTRRDADGDEVSVRGILEHPLEDEAEEIDFEFETSITNVDNFLKGLRDIATDFPVRGPIK
ncbi:MULTISPECIES: hypothetical protein [unclassified Exiguobacterium]|uniref:WapI family immunity protein n=1 Tax=unclassified Exiguobacterium TaxID=2644629 RepID=UPI0008C7C63F|nr:MULTISPECIES: hypothetical protein [unclassified Exiguobacterium]OGX78724.1 hypothetical protein A6395_10305 [Exiguobacterium sp. SH31]TCI34038.1 hypothetical protein EVJ29_12490 [Exiguobacterium sp. SH4S7]TCI43028.1 hypothetical protein EVJ31_12765 [Exiguobacterium sp. SH5S32]TCI49814.1 hypothetical protein EVJ25_13270 [Exiguobacterium sp. SH1S4]TCI59413.1 hypothetical protein EVJ21_13825 [Exiguobacterium sp. SH0S2]